MALEKSRGMTRLAQLSLLVLTLGACSSTAVDPNDPNLPVRGAAKEHSS